MVFSMATGMKGPECSSWLVVSWYLDIWVTIAAESVK